MEKVFEIYIKATPERIWEALTDSDLWRQYSFSVDASNQPYSAHAAFTRAPASAIEPSTR